MLPHPYIKKNIGLYSKISCMQFEEKQKEFKTKSCTCHITKSILYAL